MCFRRGEINRTCRVAIVAAFRRNLLSCFSAVHTENYQACCSENHPSTFYRRVFGWTNIPHFASSQSHGGTSEKPVRLFSRHLASHGARASAAQGAAHLVARRGLRQALVQRRVRLRVRQPPGAQSTGRRPRAALPGRQARRGPGRPNAGLAGDRRAVPGAGDAARRQLRRPVERQEG
jgi:hypothetical protein